MAHETNWLRTRITAATATLLAGAALIAGNSVIWTADAVADEASDTTITTPAQQQTVTIQAHGHFTENAAQEALNAVNSAREEAGLDPVELSGSLSALAQTRAVEYAIDANDAVYGFLDGSGTVFTAGLNIVNETLGTARQGSSVSELINQWLAANEDDPAEAGTYAALLSPDVTEIGFALFTSDDNTLSFALEVSEGTDPDDDAVAAAASNPAVSILVSRLTTLLSVPETMEVGDTATATYTLLLGNTSVNLVDEALWYTSDANVISIDTAGTLSAVDAGTATISLASDDVVLGSADVTVEAPESVITDDANDDTVSAPESEGWDPMPEFSDITTEPDYGESFTNENTEPTYEEPAAEADGTSEWEPAPETEPTYEEPAAEADGTSEWEPAPEVTSEPEGSSVHQEVTNVNTESETVTDNTGTDEPVAEEPSTEEPAIEEFGSDEPTAEEPAGEETGSDEPTAEEPAGEETGSDEPTAEEPAGEETGTDEPTAEEPAGEETGTYEPAGEETGTDEPTAEEPAGEETGTDESTAEEPAGEETGSDEPTAEEPTGEETGTDEPAAEDSTEGTTEEPTADDSSSNDGTAGTEDPTFDDIPSIIPDDDQSSDETPSDGSDTTGENTGNGSEGEGESDGVNDADQGSTLPDTSWPDIEIPDITDPGIVESEPEPEPEPEPESPVIVSINSELPVIYVQTDSNGADWRPTEDTTVNVTWSDGENEEIVIEPDAWTASEPNSQGIMTLIYTFDGTELTVDQVVQFVNVIPAGIERTYTVGDTIELPDTWNATYQGSEVDINVTWDTIPEDALTTPGTYQVTGTLDGGLGTVIATITVEEPAPTIRQASNPASVTTTVGTAPVLPSTVAVTYSDDTTGSAKVTWESIDPSLYAKAGSFMVSGTVDGTVLTVSITVIVEEPAPTITGVATSYVTTVSGETPQLPATVEVTWSDGVTALMAVTWDSIDPSLYMQAGSFTVTGTIDGHSDVRATCVVTVEAVPTPTNVLTITDVSTPAGTAPVLPDTVEVLYSDGTVKAYGVVWNTVDAAAYHNGGSFIVDGKVDGLGWTVSVRVIVDDPYITGVQNNLSAQTIVGIAPKLPDTASVRWSNGDITSEPVTWPAIDKDLYAHTGTFTVTGLVGGYNIPCTVTVTEEVVQTADNVAPTAMAALVAGLAGIGAIAAAVTLIIRSRRARQ